MYHGSGSSSSSRYENTDTAQRLIDAACDSLYKFGFNRHMFTVKNLKSHGYDVKKLIELVNPISQIKDLNVLDKLFGSYQCRDDFLSFTFQIEYLKTSDYGKPCLEEALSTITKPLEESDVELARKMVEYGASQRLVQKDIMEQRENLFKRQQELRTKALDIKEDQKEVLGPLYEFEEISMEQLRIQSYKLYEDDCRSKGITPILKTSSKGFKTAIGMFGETVKENHFLAFVNDRPYKKLEIANHFEKSILMLNEKDDSLINADKTEG